MKYSEHFGHKNVRSTTLYIYCLVLVFSTFKILKNFQFFRLYCKTVLNRSFLYANCNTREWSLESNMIYFAVSHNKYTINVRRASAKVISLRFPRLLVIRHRNTLLWFLYKVWGMRTERIKSHFSRLFLGTAIFRGKKTKKILFICLCRNVLLFLSCERDFQFLPLFMTFDKWDNFGFPLLDNDRVCLIYFFAALFPVHSKCT